MCLQTIYFLTKTFTKLASNKTTNRINFASIKNQLTYPDFLDIQIGAFKDFFQIGVSADTRKEEGLWQVFNDHFQNIQYDEVLNLVSNRVVTRP